MSDRFAGKPLNAPLVLFLYTLAALCFCFAWRWFLPSSADPLPYFMARWRFGNGALTFINLFPAFALSALFVSFGFGFTDNGPGSRFSPRFIDAMKQPLVAILIAASIYTALSFVVQPRLVESHEEMISKGILFNRELSLSKDSAAKGEWIEAAHHLAVCDRVWPGNNTREMVQYRDSIKVKLERQDVAAIDEAKKKEAAKPHATLGPSIPGLPVPATVTEAITLAKRALDDGRNFDANWYATVGSRLAKPGSPEASDCVKIGADAWNRIEKAGPEHPLDRDKDEKKKASYEQYARKREGFLAVSAGDWLRAYSIFESLAEVAPRDPDVVKYLAMSREGLISVAFFRDELDSMVVGAVFPDVVFSLPRSDGGRDVLHASNFYLFEDAAYLDGLELWHFNPAGQRVSSVKAQAAKWQAMIPSKEGAPAHSVILLLCLDRADPGVRIEPVWEGETPGNRLEMDLGFEDLGLLARAGTGGLSFHELDRAMEKLPPFGFLAEGFRADWLNRISDPFLFLSLSILALAFGWRLRSLKGPSLFFIPLLVALPFVMNAFTHFSRYLYTVVNTGCVLFLPFSLAVATVIILQSFLLLGSLVFLAGQRG